MELIFDKLNSMGERIDVMEKNLIDQLSPISNDVQYLKDQLLVRDQKIHELESRLSSFEDQVNRMLKVENSRKVKLFNFPAIGDTYPAVKKSAVNFLDTLGIPAHALVELRMFRPRSSESQQRSTLPFFIVGVIFSGIRERHLY